MDKLLDIQMQKKQLEDKIQKYMKSGDGNKIAFVEGWYHAWIWNLLF